MRDWLRVKEKKINAMIVACSIIRQNQIKEQRDVFFYSIPLLVNLSCVIFEFCIDT